jgi:sRNA-binding carbon storage regulator CsrA
MPEVFISAGDEFHDGVVRAAIEAPRSILILRGAKYRELGYDKVQDR